MIWFQAKENGTITEFYKDTVQNKIPVLLVSDGIHKIDKSVKDYEK